MNIFVKLHNKIKNKLFVDANPWFREHIIIPKYRRRFNNPNVTILSHNCLGGVISHDLGIRFNSPFVNLWLYPKDFIKYCRNIEYYRNCKLRFLSNEIDHLGRSGYPVAMLGDIKIHFLHYKSNEEAENTWYERTKRMNLDNIRCIMSECDTCTLDDLKEFSKLQYPTVALVHKNYDYIGNTIYIKGFEDSEEIGNTMVYKPNCYFGKKYYDDFDFVSFLNKEGTYD